MQQNQIQTQPQHQNTTPNPKPKHPARKTAITLVIIITIIAIALWIAATNGLLPTLWNINSNGWANIILGVGTLLGVVFAFIAILPQDTKDTPTPTAPHSHPRLTTHHLRPRPNSRLQHHYP